MLPLQSVQNGMDLNLLFLIVQPYLIPCRCFIPYTVPPSTLDLLTSAISSNSTSSSLSVPGCVPLWSRFCSGSIIHTRKGTSASCYCFLPQASSLISSYSQSSFFQLIDYIPSTYHFHHSCLQAELLLLSTQEHSSFFCMKDQQWGLGSQ